MVLWHMKYVTISLSKHHFFFLNIEMDNESCMILIEKVNKSLAMEKTHWVERILIFRLFLLKVSVLHSFCYYVAIKRCSCVCKTHFQTQFCPWIVFTPGYKPLWTSGISCLNRLMGLDQCDSTVFGFIQYGLCFPHHRFFKAVLQKEQDGGAGRRRRRMRRGRDGCLNRRLNIVILVKSHTRHTAMPALDSTVSQWPGSMGL